MSFCRDEANLFLSVKYRNVPNSLKEHLWEETGQGGGKLVEISISMVLWKLGEKQFVPGITRCVSQNQEGNFHFQTSITPLLNSKTNLPLGALERAPGTSEAVSGGQGRENRYTPGMPWQAVGRATAWLQGLANVGVMCCDVRCATPSLCLPPLLVT